MRKLKNILKKILEKINFILSYINIIIVPLHYYTPIINLKNIQKKLLKRVDFKLINYKEENSVKLINILKKDIMFFEKKNYYNKYNNNNYGPGYGYTESIILQALIKKKQIKRIVEIGSGISTFCIIDALKYTKDKKFKILSIEPNPSKEISNIKLKNKFILIKKKIEEISVKKITNFNPDFLFVDTSHAVKPLSDVEYIYTRLLPNIRKCIIHIHDIYFPYLYQNNLKTSSYMQWTESQLLYCYLINNKKSKIILSLPQLFHDKKNIFKNIFNEWKPAYFKNGLQVNKKKHGRYFPSSVYLKQ
jgi:hypothetical protein